MQHLIPNTLYKKGMSRKTQKFATKLAWCLFLVSLVVFFLGVKFGFRKSCPCKRNDKYEVCINASLPPILSAQGNIHT